MMKIIAFPLIAALTLSVQIYAQSKTGFRNEVNSIVAGKKATVGVSIIDAKGRAIVEVNANRRFPMQSVFKFHIALKMLAEVDKGKFGLDQPITIKKDELLPGLYSPIREAHPEGATLPLSEILEYTVSASDNAGCDILLKLLGGPSMVEGFFTKNGMKNLAIKHNEETQQADWKLQFDNWTTPNGANKVLREFYLNKRNLLSKTSHEFVWRLMRETSTGPNRLRGGLPKDAVVLHKTGTSGINKTTGISAAINDIGVVLLPDGRHFYITVLVGESRQKSADDEKIIADIAAAAWKYFNSQEKKKS